MQEYFKSGTKNELGNYRRIIDVKIFAMIIIFGEKSRELE